MKQVWENFAAGLFYQATEPGDPESYSRLKALLAQVDKDRGTAGNRLFYLSTPPTQYIPIAEQLKRAGLNQVGKGELDPNHCRKTVRKRFRKRANLESHTIGSIFREPDLPN